MRLTRARDLGARIRERRLQLGLSQAELGQLTHSTRQWIIALERGKTTVSLDHVLRTLAALDLVADIRPIEEPKSTRKTQQIVVPDAAIVDAVISRAKKSTRAIKVRAEEGKGAIRGSNKGAKSSTTRLKQPQNLDFVATLQRLMTTRLPRKSEVDNPTGGHTPTRKKEYAAKPTNIRTRGS